MRWEEYDEFGSWKTTQIADSNRYQLVGDHRRVGKRAARFEVRPDDLVAEGERAEVVTMQTKAGTDLNETEASGTQYFSLSVRLADDWQVPTGDGSQWCLISQLHGPNVFATFPSVALHVLDSFYVVTGGGDLDSPHRYTITLSNGELRRGHWIDFVIKIVFAKDTTGAVTVWRRDEGDGAFTQVASRTGVPTLQYKTSYNEGAVEDHYWKFGIYRSAQDSIINVLHMDCVARAASFDAVAKAAWGV